jgi:hypothetical protein
VHYLTYTITEKNGIVRNKYKIKLITIINNNNCINDKIMKKYEIKDRSRDKNIN